MTDSPYCLAIEPIAEEAVTLMSGNADSGQAYVFISYASADRERVLEIVAALRQADVVCWLDQHDIAGGTNWGGSIAEAIAGCVALVLMSSAASLSSRNVRQELALAWQHEKPSVPLRLDTAPVPTDVAYWLATAQWVEVLDHPVDDWLPRVTNALARFTLAAPVEALPVSAAARPAQPSVLPSPASSFVGREREVAEVTALLHAQRVVTLTGLGGIGKTRVAIAVGHRLADEYADGVVFVDLAPLRDPALVLSTIAVAVGVRESGEGPLVDALASVLRQRRLLLILDNVEQVVAAAADISRLVTACPSLAVLATSRELLRIAGEVEYPIAPLPLPASDPGGDVERLRANPTIALFVQRARSTKSGFDLTPENAVTVVAICQRLDGLPLAIELAAARSRVLTPQALLTRLDEPLAFLTGGARDLPNRQQTIRDTIQWSYDLLTADEQHLFRRLSVFVGGWSLESAEAVVNTDDDLGIDLFDGLTSLVDKSLVVQHEQPDGSVRFTMLGIIREYADKRLTVSGEADAVRHALAHYIDTITGDVERHLGQTRHAPPLLDRVDVERANLRAVLQWCQTRDAHDPERARIGLRIAVQCFGYWDAYGGVVEGKPWLEAFATHDDLPADLRARAYGRASEFARQHRETEHANRLAECAVRLADASGDPSVQAEARIWLAGSRLAIGKHDDAEALLEASLALAQAAGLPQWIGAALMTQQEVAVATGDYERVQALAAACIAATQDDHENLALWSLVTYEVARMAFARGDLATAEREARRALGWSQAPRYAITEAESHVLLARVLHERGERREALAMGAVGAEQLLRDGTPGQVADHLVPLAVIAAECGHPALAAQLLSLSRQHRGQVTIPERARREQQRAEKVARAALGDSELERIQREAEALTLDDAVAAVIAAFSSDMPNPPR
jgi:predicted ATPase